MFKSATFKLTSWYLGIIVAISLLFSIVIYAIATRELATRIELIQPAQNYNGTLQQFFLLRDTQLHAAEASLIASLVISNLCIWTVGGICSYYLARRTLQPIEEAHEAQSRFVSDASHELRTPLASMKTELEVALRDHSLSPKDTRELLESNLEEVNKLTELSGNLLQLSRLEVAAIKEKVALEPALRAALRRFGKEGKRVTIQSPKAATITGNRLQVEEIATILIDNALKYSPASTSVIISFTATKQLAGFSIQNEGDGIPETSLPYIFDRFYRIDRSRTSQDTNKGYGLGLSLAKKIVEQHNGELSVSSAANGLTTFTVLLPKFTQPKAKTDNSVTL